MVEKHDHTIVLRNAKVQLLKCTQPCCTVYTYKAFQAGKNTKDKTRDAGVNDIRHIPRDSGGYREEVV